MHFLLLYPDYIPYPLGESQYIFYSKNIEKTYSESYILS